MNLDDLTIGQAKELAKMFGGGNGQAFESPHIGKYVIVRSRDSGVQAGVLVSHHGNEVVLNSARRLWSWHAKKNHTLSAVALYGLKLGKLTPDLDGFHVIGVCEILPCSDEAKCSIEGMESHEQ